LLLFSFFLPCLLFLIFSSFSCFIWDFVLVSFLALTRLCSSLSPFLWWSYSLSPFLFFDYWI
jgi:hypothetical protein